MLSWDVTGAAALTLSGGGNSWTVTGDTYRIVQSSATTNYTLTASNSAGGVTRQTSVTVSAPATLAWVRSMVYAFGQLLSEERADVGTVYVQSDQVGSPSLLTDTGGHLVGRTKGLPFGERVWSSGTQSARRFTNHEDQQGSPVYMQARMYLPAYGRFAQPDPAYDQIKLDPESWNLYGYVTNNPVTHTDPDGRKAFGVKAEGEAFIISNLIGNWSDVGFLGVSYSARIMLGWSATAINWEVNPAKIILDQDGFFVAYAPSYVTETFGKTSWGTTAQIGASANMMDVDDKGKTNINEANAVDLIRNFKSALKDAQYNTIKGAGYDVYFYFDNLSKGKLGESGPGETPFLNKPIWKIKLDLNQISGSMKLLMGTVVHELDHGVFFVTVAEKSVSKWNELTSPSNGAIRMYEKNRNNPRLADYWHKVYENSQVESRAFATWDRLRTEQGW